MADVPLPTSPVANSVSVQNQPLDVSAQPIDVDASDQLSDSTQSAGSGNAAKLQLGNIRTKVDFVYDVTVDGQLRIEVSNDEVNWFFYNTIDTNNAGVPQEDTVQLETMFEYVRVYADGGDFNDGDVNDIIMASKGVS